MSGIKGWEIRASIEGDITLCVMDEYNYTFQLHLSLLDVQEMTAALEDHLWKELRRRALLRRPTIETDVAVAIDRIQRDRSGEDHAI